MKRLFPTAIVALLAVSAVSPVAAQPTPDRAASASFDYRDTIYEAATAARDRLLNQARPVTQEMMEAPDAADWLMWRRTYDTRSDSPLKAITPTNVSRLGLAWGWSLSPSSNEITPLVHDGILFVGSGNRIQAFDGATGDLLWQYVRRLPSELSDGSFSIQRNIALYKGKVFAATADNHVIALDARTGKLVWDHNVLPGTDPRAALTAGPMVVKGKVIQGVSNCFTMKGGCFIVALDGETGTESWRFNSIAWPGTPEGETWNGAPLDERFGASIWSSGSYDPKLNLIYFGTGQTYDVATLLVPRPGTASLTNNDALYTNSTLAIDPDTGKLVWFYQHQNRDVWDMDWSFERTLATVKIGGKERDVVVTAGKLAIYDVLDRKSGQYLFSRDLGLQNIVQTVDPKTGVKTPRPDAELKPNVPNFMCPFSGGARSWPTTAYDARTGALYLPLQEACMQFTWSPRSAAGTAGGGLDIRWSVRPPANSDGRYGRLQAVDLSSGRTLWMQRRRAGEASSLLLTAGGVVFNGSRDRIFRASDARSGKVLWEKRLSGTPSSSPITYSVGGRQYVAVVTGGGGPQDVTFSRLTPEIENPTSAVTLWVFALEQPGQPRGGS